MTKMKKPDSAAASSPAHAALIVAAALVAHGLCIGATFYLDDQPHILKSTRILQNNPAITGVPFIFAIFESSWNAEEDSRGTGQRFITYLVWNVLIAVAGLSSPAIHGLNLILHILTALLVFVTMRELMSFDTESIEDPAPGYQIAVLAALIFAVHPLCSEIPNYASQSSISLVTFFGILASLCALRWLKNHDRNWLLGAGGSVILASLSKEPGVFHAGMNVVLIVFALTPRRDLFAWLKKRYLFLGLAGILAIGIFLYFLNRSGFIRSYVFALIRLEDGFLHNGLTQCRIFWEYARRFVFPTDLCSDHLIPGTVSAGDVSARLGFLGLLFLAALPVAFWRRNRVLALLGALALSHILIRFSYPSPEIMVEYRIYPALPWASALAAMLIRLIPIKRRQIRIGVATAVVIVLAILSFKRSLVWQSRDSIVADVLRQYPLHIRSQSYLQQHDYQEGRHEAVVARQEQVQRNLNTVLRFNQESEKRHRQYDAGQALAGFMVCEQLVGYALIELGRPGEAAARMTNVIGQMLHFFEDDNSRAFAVLYRARGKAKAALGDKEAARSDYEACLVRKPGDTESLRLLEEL